MLILANLFIVVTDFKIISFELNFKYEMLSYLYLLVIHLFIHLFIIYWLVD